MDTKLYTMQELATMYGYSLAHLRRLSSDKMIIPVKKEGRNLMFSLEQAVPALKHSRFKTKKLNLIPPYEAPIVPKAPKAKPVKPDISLPLTEITITDVPKE